MGPVQGDGLGYREKVFWGSKDLSAPSALHPDLLVLGTRLDVQGRSADISHPTQTIAGDIGDGMLVGVDFPSAGCWQITG